MRRRRASSYPRLYKRGILGKRKIVRASGRCENCKIYFWWKYTEGFNYTAENARCSECRGALKAVSPWEYAMAMKDCHYAYPDWVWDLDKQDQKGKQDAKIRKSKESTEDSEDIWMHGGDKEKDWGSDGETPELPGKDTLFDESTPKEGLPQKTGDAPEIPRTKRKYTKGKSKYLSGKLVQLTVFIAKEHKMFLEVEAATYGLDVTTYVQDMLTDRMRGLGYPAPRKRRTIRKHREEHLQDITQDKWES